MNEMAREAVVEFCKQQRFEPGHPGPLLLNIQMLIDALAKGVPTASKYFALPIRCLANWNERLETPIAHKLKRPQLKSFPTLAGLFLLLRASGLAVGQTKPKRVVLIDPMMREQWEKLNPTEQYMSLMDVWWTEVDWTILGERDSFGVQLQSDTRDLCYQLSHQPTGVNIDCTSRSYWFRTAAALLEQFGWIKIAYTTEVADGKVADLQSMQLTDFGHAMFAALDGLMDFRNRDAATVRQKLQPLFPDWKNSLLAVEQPFREGRYKLKLSWLDVWRRLEAPANTSLNDVTILLLDSFGFEQDHLYRLDYRDPCGREVHVEDPQYPDVGILANEVLLGELPLGEGDSIGLLFDFGDSWEFTITIESIDESATDDFDPLITASHGESPKQYEFYDDEDYGDDCDDDCDDDDA